MQDIHFQELESRASLVGQIDEVRQLEAQSRVHQTIKQMKAEGKALELSAEEQEMLFSFRRFKLKVRKDGEVFKWQTRRDAVPETQVYAGPDSLPAECK